MVVIGFRPTGRLAIDGVRRIEPARPPNNECADQVVLGSLGAFLIASCACGAVAAPALTDQQVAALVTIGGGVVATAIIIWAGALLRFLRISVSSKALTAAACVAVVAGLVVGERQLGLGFLTEEWSWKWVDRASWAVAVVGLPLVVYQVAVLRREQARKPKIAFGVAPGGTKVEQLRSSANVSAVVGRIDIQMVAQNIGTLTARGVLFNYRLPDNSPVVSIEPALGSGEFIQAHRLWQAVLDRLQPQSMNHLYATLVLSPDFAVGQLKINAAAAMDDFEEANGTLTLQVSSTATNAAS